MPARAASPIRRFDAPGNPGAYTGPSRHPYPSSRCPYLSSRRLYRAIPTPVPVIPAPTTDIPAPSTVIPAQAGIQPLRSAGSPAKPPEKQCRRPPVAQPSPCAIPRPTTSTPAAGLGNLPPAFRPNPGGALPDYQHNCPVRPGKSDSQPHPAVLPASAASPASTSSVSGKPAGHISPSASPASSRASPGRTASRPPDTACKVASSRYGSRR